MITPSVRGEVTYKARAKQERDFTGLRYGNITPTDIDGFMDYHNNCFLFYEAKYITAPPMEKGQILSFERLCDALWEVKKSIYIVFKHTTPVDKAIDFATGEVESIRVNRKWYPVRKKGTTVKQVSDWFIGRYGNDPA